MFSSKIKCRKFFSVLSTVLTAKKWRQMCSKPAFSECAWAVLKRAASDPLQPLRTTRQSWLSNCAAPLSTDQFNLFHFRLSYAMKHVIGYPFCIISDQAQICIVNKSICHFSCLALSQCTGLRGQKKNIINGVVSRFYHKELNSVTYEPSQFYWVMN